MIFEKNAFEHKTMCMYRVAIDELYLVQISGLWVHLGTIKQQHVSSSYIGAHCSVHTAAELN